MTPTQPSASDDSQTLRGSAFVALALTILFWAATPLILKYFTGVMDAWTVNGLRYLLTAVACLPFVIANRKKIPANKNIWRDAAMPALCHLLGQGLWGVAPYYNDATIMMFVSRASLLITVVIGFWLLKSERQLARSPLFWIGVVMTMAGLTAMFGGGLHAGNTSLPGMGILLGFAVCWSFYSVFVKKQMSAYPPALAFGVVSLLVAPGLGAAMFAFGNWHAMFTLSWMQWALLAISAWFSIALGHALYYQVVQALGPIICEGSLSLAPFTTALLAFLILGEHLTRGQWFGGILLVAATYFLLMVRKRLATQR